MLKWVLIGGAVGGAVSIGLALQEGKELKRRGTLMQATLERSGSALDAHLRSLGDDYRDTIRREAEAFGQDLAERTAREVLEVKYGITPGLIASFQSASNAVTRVFR